MGRAYAGGIIAVALFAAACGENPTDQSAPLPVKPTPPTPAPQGGPTPLQGRIKELMAEREARGLPKPMVSFEFNSAQGSSVVDLQSKSYGPGEGYSYRARTVIHYNGPAEAGLQRWPAVTLSPEHAQKLGLSSAELQDRYVASREKADPDFWQRYELGLEPRKYTITESHTTTYALAPATAGVSAAPATADVTATAAAQEDLVFGFSLNLPLINEKVEFGFEDVEELEFSVVAEWGFGLRLPVSAELESPAPLAEGSTYAPASKVQGLNYSGAQYAGVGLPAESGREVYFRWIGKGCVEFSGVIDSGKQCAALIDADRGESFVTPFGPGDEIPFPRMDLELIDYGLAGIDLDVDTSAESNLITADWTALGAALGSGHLSYNNSTTSRALTPVRAIDGPGQALFSVDGFLFHFTEVEVSARLELWVDVEIPLLLTDLEWDDSWSISLGRYDITDFVDRDFLGSDGASVGVHHPGTGYTGPRQLRLDVEVENVAPTADISLAGGQNIVVNGLPTVFGNTGDNFTFTGTSHDPGRDDLTLSWDWGDGPPAPDQSASYPLAGPTGPNDATDVRSHAFDGACLYDVTLKSVDDDQASGEDHVSVLVTETGGAARLEGYWQHQLGRKGGNLLEPATVECYLAMVGRVSAVFSEARAASSVDAAFAVLNLRQNSGSELEQLDRELLVAWLNFASGAFGYTELVDTNSDKIGDTPLHQVMQVAEGVRLDASSTPRDLKRQTQLVHKISVRG